MPHTKFQVVFGSDASVDLQMLIDDELRLTHLDLRDAPFPKAMLGEADVQHALKEWMLAKKGPPGMKYKDFVEALHAAGVDLESLIARYAVNSVA